MEGKTTFIKLIPMKNSDSKIMIKNKVNPLQRIEIFEKNSIEKISQFILKTAFPQDEKAEYKVPLYIKIQDSFSSLPLSICVGELLIMAHQTDEPEIRYSFIKNDNIADKPLPNGNKSLILTKELNKIYEQRTQNDQKDNHTVKIDIPFQHNIFPQTQINEQPNHVNPSQITIPAQVDPINAQNSLNHQFPSLISIIPQEQPSDLTLSGFGMNQAPFQDSIYHMNDSSLHQQTSIFGQNPTSFSRFFDNQTDQSSSNAHTKVEQAVDSGDSTSTLKSELEKMLRKPPN